MTDGTAKRVRIAPLEEGERWGVKFCEGCQRRRMMPMTEMVCLACQDAGGCRRPRVMHLPSLGAVREQAGLTLVDLEALVGISRFRLHLIEAQQKKVRVKTARKIAGALGVTVAEVTRITPSAIPLPQTARARARTQNERGAA